MSKLEIKLLGRASSHQRSFKQTLSVSRLIFFSIHSMIRKFLSYHHDFFAFLIRLFLISCTHFVYLSSPLSPHIVLTSFLFVFTYFGFVNSLLCILYHFKNKNKLTKKQRCNRMRNRECCTYFQTPCPLKDLPESEDRE